MFEKILCIIPARGGSKSIPKKNMTKVSGVPLVGYSIRTAVEANIPVSNIIVTSDSDEILNYAKTWFVNTRKRPDELSGDTASTESAMIDVLLNSYENTSFDSVLLLQPTSPIRFNGRIKDAIQIYKNGGYDSLLTATKFYPFFWKKVGSSSIDGNPWVSTYHPRNRPMRQDIEEKDLMYFDNGNLYITNTQVLLETQCRIGKNPCVYEISELEAMQIDNPLELQIIDKIVSASHGAIFRTNFLETK